MWLPLVRGLAALVLVAVLALSPLVGVAAAQRGNRDAEQQAENPEDPSLIQQDADGDYVPDFMDNCPNIQNPNQEDANGDGSGDPCQPPPDSDADTVPDHADNCPGWANSPQDDTDGDGLGNGCDDTPLGDAPPPAEDTGANFSEPETVEGIDEAMAAPAAPVEAAAEPDGGDRDRGERQDDADGAWVVEEPAERVVALEEQQQTVEGEALANGEPVPQEGDDPDGSGGDGSGQGGEGRRDGGGQGDGGGGGRGDGENGGDGGGRGDGGADAGAGNGDGSGNGGGGNGEGDGGGQSRRDEGASSGASGEGAERSGPRRNLDFPDTLPAEPPPTPSRSFDDESEPAGLEIIARIDAGKVPEEPSGGAARRAGDRDADDGGDGSQRGSGNRSRNGDGTDGGDGRRDDAGRRGDAEPRGDAESRERGRRGEREAASRDDRPRDEARGDGAAPRQDPGDEPPAGDEAPAGATEVGDEDGENRDARNRGAADQENPEGDAPAGAGDGADDGNGDAEESDAAVRPIDGIAIGADPPPLDEGEAMPRYTADTALLGERLGLAQDGDGGDRGNGRDTRWRDDEHYRGGTYQRVRGDLNIDGTRNDTLYMTQRVGVDRQRPGSFVYEIPVPRDGTYRVRLHFVELIWGTSEDRDEGEGRRIFDVAAEGETVLDDYDIYADVGALTAVVKQFDVEVRDDAVSLRFVGERDQPVVSAIEVLEEPPDDESGDGNRRRWSGVRPGALLPRRVDPGWVG